MEFGFSDRCTELRERLLAFMDEHVYPAESVYHEQLVASGHPHAHPPVMEELKERARELGLWNLFLPHPSEEAAAPGLSNLEYAPLAEIMGRSHIAPEACNCAAPDTGNMEVLNLFGTPEQKERWLRPLLDGEIRSAFVMTEPDVASLGRDQHPVADRARRRRLRTERPQVVGVGRDARALQDPDRDGQDRSRRSAAQAAVDDPRAQGHARRDDPAQPAGVRLRSTRRATPRSCSRTSRVPAANLISEAGPRLPDRAGPARARPHPPLHAHDRRGRARARAHVQAGIRARHVRPARGRARQHPGLDRRVAD